MQDRERIKTISDIVLKGYSLTAIIITVIASSVNPIISKLFPIETLDSKILSTIIVPITAITMIFAVVLWFIGARKQFWDLALLKKFGELNDITERLNNITEANKDITKHIDNCKTNPIENIVRESCVITESSMFYEKLIEARERAQNKTSIRLTNFATHPVNRNDKNKDIANNNLNYFKNELAFYKNKPDIFVYKIVSIHTREKLKDCKDLVLEAERLKLGNYNLAYLNIEELNYNLPGVIGIDVIGDEVFLMNPEFARHTPKSGWVSIHMKSPKFAEIYTSYHNALWREIDEGRGYILYDGERGGISSKIEEYWKALEKNIEKLTDERRVNPEDCTNNHKTAEVTDVKVKTPWIKSLMPWK